MARLSYTAGSVERALDLHREARRIRSWRKLSSKTACATSLN